MAVVIEYGNVNCKVIGLNDMNIRYEIAQKLSYTTGGFGAPKQLHVKFNVKTCMSYTGLIPYIINILNRHNLEVVLEDKRVEPESNANFNLVDGIIPRDYQQNVFDNAKSRMIVQMATGAGKAMPLDTEVLTPNGFIKLNDIHVGSVVYDENGNETIVTAEYPQNELKQEWKITFNDGTFVTCCKDHMWKFTTSAYFGKNVWKEDTIENIVKNYKLIRSGKKLNIAIPVCKAINFSKKDLFLPPYLMGALLGDGGFSQSNITFTNVEQDVIDNVNSLVAPWGEFHHRADKNHPQLHFVGGRDNEFRNYCHKTFGYKLTNEKFIPNEYKMSSIEDRFELVRGLIDTDGSVTQKGHIRIGFVSEQLAKDLQFVIRSLGYRCTMSVGNREDKSTTYDLYIRGCDNKLFSSKKHNERFTNKNDSKNHHYDVLKITSVEKLNTKVEMKCLTVNSPYHTFVCKDFIVTHNTLVLAGMIAQFDVKPVVVMSPKATLAYQLRDEIAKFLGVHVGILTGESTDIQDITVATPQTALKSDILTEAKALLVDECQFLGSYTLFSVARKAKNAYYRCAVSATPWRDGDDDLLIEAAINVRNPKSNVNASTLIKKGKLTPVELYFIKQEANCEWLGSYAETYNKAIVYNEDRNSKIISKIKESVANDYGSVLVLIGKLHHGNLLLNKIRNEIENKEFDFVHENQTFHLHTAEFINGSTSMEERMAILEAARQEKVKFLIGSTIADEGLDVPALKVLILAGAGKSSTRAFQRVGRVLRLFKGRNVARVYDFMDMMPTFYKHFMYRKALYCTEPEWKKHMHEI